MTEKIKTKVVCRSGEIVQIDVEPEVLINFLYRILEIRDNIYESVLIPVNGREIEIDDPDYLDPLFENTIILDKNLTKHEIVAALFS